MSICHQLQNTMQNYLKDVLTITTSMCFHPCLCVGTCACVFMDVYVSSLGLAQAGFKPEALFLHQLT